jgi:hypothetical protein
MPVCDVNWLFLRPVFAKNYSCRREEGVSETGGGGWWKEGAETDSVWASHIDVCASSMVFKPQGTKRHTYSIQKLIRHTHTSTRGAAPEARRECTRSPPTNTSNAPVVRSIWARFPTGGGGAGVGVGEQDSGACLPHSGPGLRVRSARTKCVCTAQHEHQLTNALNMMMTPLMSLLFPIHSFQAGRGLPIAVKICMCGRGRAWGGR